MDEFGVLTRRTGHCRGLALRTTRSKSSGPRLRARTSRRDVRTNTHPAQCLVSSSRIARALPGADPPDGARHQARRPWPCGPLRVRKIIRRTRRSSDLRFDESSGASRRKDTSFQQCSRLRPKSALGACGRRSILRMPFAFARPRAVGRSVRPDRRSAAGRLRDGREVRSPAAREQTNDAFGRPGGCCGAASTRSHSELGRERLQRRWYSVLRRGRVGRCQVCQTHRFTLRRTRPRTVPGPVVGRRPSLPRSPPPHQLPYLLITIRSFAGDDICPKGRQPSSAPVRRRAARPRGRADKEYRAVFNARKNGDAGEEPPRTARSPAARNGKAGEDGQTRNTGLSSMPGKMVTRARSRPAPPAARPPETGRPARTGRQGIPGCLQCPGKW